MHHYCSDKDVNKLICELVRTGANFFPGKKHGKLCLPSGKIITVPKSPSDCRTLLNIRSYLRR